MNQKGLERSACLDALVYVWSAGLYRLVTTDMDGISKLTERTVGARIVTLASRVGEEDGYHHCISICSPTGLYQDRLPEQPGIS